MEVKKYLPYNPYGTILVSWLLDSLGRWFSGEIIVGVSMCELGW